MAGFSQTILMGNLTRDPEARFTPSGKQVTEVSVAVNRVWMKDGVKQESVTFVDCTLWGRTAEILCEYCQKGSLVHFVGRLEQDTWDDKETGQKRSKLKLVVQQLTLMPRAGGSGGGGGSSAPASRGESNGEAFDGEYGERGPGGNPADDETPF